MSYEAVPCMVRAPSQDGRKGAILGVIIRPSSSQEGAHSNSLPTPPGVIPIKGAKSIVIQPGSKRSLILSKDQILKMMNGRGVGMCSPSLLSVDSSTSSSLVATGQSNISSAQLLEMELSPSSPILIHSGIPSSTPHSGIQSVPTTPPSKSYLQQRNEERTEDETKFDDMPRLRPIDEETATASCSSSLPPLDESSLWQPSECESSLPSSLINTSWNPEEIATQLLSMAAFDPQKIQEVTALMLQRSKEDVDKKDKYEKKRKNDISELQVAKKKRKRECCESEVSTSTENMRKQIEKETSEEELGRSEEEPLDEESRLVNYRLAMRRRISHKVEETRDRVILSLSRLSIGEKKAKIKDKINPLFSPIEWQNIKKRRFSLSETLKKELKTEVEANRRKYEMHKKGRKNVERIEPTKKLIRRGEKVAEPYENIKTNAIDDLLRLPSLSSPFSCNCTKGGCSSPNECIHRSLRVFCTPSSCRLPTCSNRLSRPSTLFLSNGILKTSQAKKENQFLGEIVGEVISISCMANRLLSLSSFSPIRAFSFTPDLFIDCTAKGDITRFIRHSCQPNSSIQIWWESGIPHMCIFSRFPISSNSVITVDLSFLTPVSFKCNCTHGCSGRMIHPSNSILLHQSKIYSSTYSHGLFLRRNLKTIVRKKKLYSSLLFTLYFFIDQKFRRIDGKVRRVYISFLNRLRKASINGDSNRFAYLVSSILNISDDPIDTQSLRCIRNRLISGIPKEDEGKEKNKSRRSDQNRSGNADISYLDAAVPVGSYNPDEWNGEGVKDAVRCICGVLEEDGEMIECDVCHFWLHSDCLLDPSTDSFKCPLCVDCISSPRGDIPLKDQPIFRLEGCIYYKALENRRKMQIRVSECVYVKRMFENNHKKILRALEKKGKLNEPMKEESVDKEESIPPRSMLRVFRVERLFQSPHGHRFLFGFYYARPHETFSDESRLFHPNEVFATPFYDTLPLDAVVGKCVVMAPALFCEGRPLFPSYKENDVLVCEYQLDRNQRHFDKCRNLYKLNREPYAFQKFESVRSLQRCFTPFVYSSALAHSTDHISSDTVRYQRQQAAKLVRIIDSLHIDKH